MNSFQATPSLFFDLLGINTENQLFKQFQSEFDSTIIRRENTNNSTSKKYDYDLLYKEKGIYLNILNDEVISVKFYLSPNPICQIYQGKVVNELSPIIDETKITRIADYKRSPNSDPNRLTNDYVLENVSVSFDSMTGEMLYVEISEI